MNYVDTKKYKREDGSLNFNAYVEAQVANGDKCHGCRQYILFGARGQRILCDECEGEDL